MADLYNQISNVVDKIFAENYVADIAIKTCNIQNNSDLPYERIKSKKTYNEPIQLKGFFFVEQSELVALAFGKKNTETGTCLVRVSELKKKNLWDFDNNICKIQEGFDKIILFNKEYTVESVTHLILLGNNFLFVQLKFNLSSYE